MADILDVRTIHIFASVLYGIVGLIFLHISHSEETYPGFKQWVVAIFAGATGYMLVGLRSYVPLLLSVPIANFLIAFSWVQLKRGLNFFFGDAHRNYLDYYLLLVVFGVFSISFVFIPENITLRIILIFSYYSLLVFQSAYVAYSGSKRIFGSPATPLILVLAAIGVLGLLLVSQTIWFNFHFVNIFNSGLTYPMVIITCLTLSVAVYFNLILLNIQRVSTNLDLANEKIKVLRGILPTCQHCKQIRIENQDANDQSSWISIESYISSHSEAQFSHGICPDCIKEHHPKIWARMQMAKD